MAAHSSHNIVILGGGFAGLTLAHLLMKQLASIRKETKQEFKVVLVANSSHFWFTVGAPRAMWQPYPHDNMDSFNSISKGFAKYPTSDFEFVFGHVIGIDTESRAVQYKAKDASEALADTTSELPYHTLVIATGSKGPSPLFSIHGSHVPTLEAYKQMQARIPDAKSVVIMGGGAAGVETAGELAHLYGKGTANPKEITIYSGAGRLLAALQPAIGLQAEQKLNNMGVRVIHGVKLTSSETLASGETTMTFNTGEKQTVDILVNATGRKPNVPFLPPTIPTDDKGRIEADKTMRVLSQDRIWTFGDVSSQSNATVIHINFAASVTAANIVADLTGKGKVKDFNPPTTKDMQLVPIGPNDGVGAMFGWRLPAFMVRMIKSKTFMFDKATATVNG